MNWVAHRNSQVPSGVSKGSDLGEVLYLTLA